MAKLHCPICLAGQSRSKADASLNRAKYCWALCSRERTLANECTPVPRQFLKKQGGTIRFIEGKL